MVEGAMQMPHALTLKDRKVLTMTGVTEVVSFHEELVALRTEMGDLAVHGSGLQLKTLTLEGGQVAVEGTVTALVYQQTSRDGWLRRLLG